MLGIYLASSLLYCVALKHVPVLELAFVASGFVLRALGGAIATHVPPSGWFLLVCSLGALMVATAKRFSELTVLGADGASHRPVLRWYSLTALRLSQRAMAVAMIVAYLLWAGSGHDAWMRWWHLASAVPLALALARFDRLTARADQQAGGGPDRAGRPDGRLRACLAGPVRAGALGGGRPQARPPAAPGGS